MRADVAGLPRPAAARAIRLSTADIPESSRGEWLREVIGREYADIDITSPPGGRLFNEMTITPWRDLQLSSIRSNEITLTRRRPEPRLVGQDAYFAVVLLSGQYRLEQDGREAVLRPGDIALYDATRMHRIECPQTFSKLLVSIPRGMLRDRLGRLDSLTAVTISGRSGLGAVASSFIRTVAEQAQDLPEREFSVLSGHGLDLLVRTLAGVAPQQVNLARSGEVSLMATKAVVEMHLGDPSLSATAIAHRVGLSSRYINRLFAVDGTSLMRYVLHRRLERCHDDLSDASRGRAGVSQIAWRWGFNDPAHFSRAFKAAFGYPPRDCRAAGGADQGQALRSASAGSEASPPGD